MAFRIRYHYRQQVREIGYANDKHKSPYEAIALVEGLDLAEFHRLENQVVNVSRNDRKMLKNFQQEYFQRLGISQVVVFREE